MVKSLLIAARADDTEVVGPWWARPLIAGGSVGVLSAVHILHGLQFIWMP